MSILASPKHVVAMWEAHKWKYVKLKSLKILKGRAKVRQMEMGDDEDSSIVKSYPINGKVNGLSLVWVVRGQVNINKISERNLNGLTRRSNMFRAFFYNFFSMTSIYSM